MKTVTVPFAVSDQNLDEAIDQIKLDLLDGVNDPQDDVVTKDPLTGRPLSLTLTLPDTANQTACDKINASPAFAKCGTLIPDGLFVLNVENMALATAILKPITAPNDSPQIVDFGMHRFIGGSAAFGSGTLGSLRGNGTVNTYTDGPINPQPSAFVVGGLIIANADAAPLTIPLNDLTITFDGGQTITLPKTNPITLPARTGSTIADDEQLFLVIDLNGNIYTRFQFATRNGVGQVISPFKDYGASVAAGITF